MRLDQPAQHHVVSVAVGPGLARRERRRHRTDGIEDQFAALRPVPVPDHPAVVRQAAGMGEQAPHRDDRPGLRQPLHVAADGSIQRDRARIDKLHDRERGDVLAHGSEVKQRALSDGNAKRQRSIAGAPEADGLTVAHHRHRRAGNGVPADQLAQLRSEGVGHRGNGFRARHRPGATDCTSSAVSARNFSGASAPISAPCPEWNARQPSRRRSSFWRAMSTAARSDWPAPRRGRCNGPRAARGHASSAAAAKAVRPIKALWSCNKRRLCDVLWLRSMARSSMR